jgi:hypothetical protein
MAHSQGAKYGKKICFLHAGVPFLQTADFSNVSTAVNPTLTKGTGRTHHEIDGFFFTTVGYLATTS